MKTKKLLNKQRARTFSKAGFFRISVLLFFAMLGYLESANAQGSKLIHFWDFNQTLPNTAGASGGGTVPADSLGTATLPLYPNYTQDKSGAAVIRYYRPSRIVRVASSRDSVLDNGIGGSFLYDYSGAHSAFAGAKSQDSTESSVPPSAGNMFVRSRNPSDSCYFYLSLPTGATGANAYSYKNVKLNFTVSGSSSKMARYLVFSYSTDGVTWNPLTSAMDTFNLSGLTNSNWNLDGNHGADTLAVRNPITEASGWYPIGINFSSVTNANNNPNFKIRFQITGSGKDSTGADGSSGNIRYDNFSLTGDTMVIPTNQLVQYWDFNTTNPIGGGGGIALGTAANPLYPSFAKLPVSDSAKIEYSSPSGSDGSGGNAGILDNVAPGSVIYDYSGKYIGNDTNSLAADNIGVRARNPVNNATMTNPSYMYLKIPSTDYKNIKLNFAVTASSTKTAYYMVFQYTTDGSTYKSVTPTMNSSSISTYSGSQGDSLSLHTGTLLTDFGTSTWAPVNINFSSDANVNSNPKFAVRMSFVGGTYLTSNSGNVRFDNISIFGDSATTTTACPFVVSIASNTGNLVCTGTSVTYTAIASGSGTTGATLTYQWQVNGVNKGTNSTIYSYAPANGDIVTCLVTTNLVCAASGPTVTSNAITMTVSSAIVPVVTLNSTQGSHICPIQANRFTATPTNGGLTPSYQWFISEYNRISNTYGSPVQVGNTGTDSTINYTYTALTGDSSYIITCKMTSSVGACASPATVQASDTVFVNPNVSAPTINLVLSTGNNVCLQSTVVITANTTFPGSSPLYSWYVNGVLIYGSSSNVFSTDTLTDGTTISCLLTSSYKCANIPTATSNTITMQIHGVAPYITGLNGIRHGLHMCPGSSAQLNVSNDGNSNIKWSTGQTTQTINVSVGGVYFVSLTDGQGCNLSNSDTLTIDQIPYAYVSSSTNVGCGAANSGAATVIASGAVPPYSYTWSSGQTTASVTGLIAGNYTVTVSDAKGCTNIPKKLMYYYDFNTLAGLSGPTSPANFLVDSAEYSAFGSHAPKSYMWYKTLNGVTNSYETYWDVDSKSGLADNLTDTFNVRMINGSPVPAGNVLRLRNPSDSMQLLMNMPTTGYQNLIFTYDVMSSSLSSGIRDHIFSYSTNGGTTWSTAGLNVDSLIVGGNLTFAREQLDLRTAPGVNNNPNFVLRVMFAGGNNGTPAKGYSDASGNSRIDNVSLDGDTIVGNTSVAITQFTNTLTPVNENCATGGMNGSATVTSSNGSGSYSYSWSGPGGYAGGNTNVETGLKVGTYTVTVTDTQVNGCVKTVSATVYGNASDINADGVTNNTDFLLLVGKFNQHCVGCREDINVDGVVNNSDFLILVGKFNQTCD